jgi:mono/diheme cytochrome c family protein
MSFGLSSRAAITNGGTASMKQVVIGLVVVVIVGCLTSLRSYAREEVQDARVQKGKVWYDKYCIPCHGAGGKPGSAVFAATKKPVDLRTIAQRNGGNFPSMRWWNFVFSSQPRGVHAEAWKRIRTDQTETVEVERDVAAHGVAANIEYYVESIQDKGK